MKLSSKPGRFAALGLTLALTMASGLIAAWPAQAIAEPTVTVNQAATQADPTSSPTIAFDVHFSETISGLNLSHVVITDFAGGTQLLLGPAPTGQDFVITLTGASQPGTVTVSLLAGAGESVAHPGVFSQASTSTDNVVTWQYPDPQPTVTVNQAGSQDDPTTGSPVLFTAVFSQPVALDPSAVEYSGSADPTSATVTGSGTTFTIAVSGMSQSGSVSATIPAGAAHAIAGPHEPNTDSTSTDNTVDYQVTTVPLTVVVTPGAGEGSISNAYPLMFTVTFSRPVTGFTNVDIGGTADYAGSGITGSGADYSVSVVGMSRSGTVTVGVPAGAAQALSDGAENSASNTLTITFIRGLSTPSVTIDQASGQADPTGNSPIAFDVVFNQPVTGFDGSDVHLAGTAGASTATVTGSGSSYTVEVSGMTKTGTVIATIPAGAAFGQLLPDSASLASTSTDDTVTFDAASSTSTPPARPTPTKPASSGPTGPNASLAATGSNVHLLLLCGAALLVLGLGMLVTERRTRPRH